MIKKRFIVGAAVGTAGLFALTGASMAATSAHPGGEASGIKDRVAEILGIAPEELQDAVQQARSEAKQEKLEERLAQAVADEVITQEEADAVLDWYAGKPEALQELSHREHHELRRAVKSDSLEEVLAELVEEEVLTQDESDEIAAWITDRPSDILEEIKPERPDRGRHFRGFKGRMFDEGPGDRMFEGRFQLRPYGELDDDVEESDEAESTAVAVGNVA